MTGIEEERDRLIEIAGELVAIPSINPDLVPGAEGERALAEVIARRLHRTPGIDVELQDAGGDRPNVIASVGMGEGRTLMLNGHIDTVGVAGMPAPFDPRVDGARLYGRGSYDMKGSMAGAILLLEDIARARNFPGRLIVTFVVDEEYASKGTQRICEELPRWRPDAAIVLENTDLDICIAHKGFAWAEIITRGRAAHGSRYWLGVDAIAHMGHIQVALEQLGEGLLSRLPHPLLGPPSVHASLISGGQELSSYPEECRLELERRTLPGESAEMIRAELQGLLDRVAADRPGLDASLNMGLVRDPFCVSEEEMIVQTLRCICADERGVEPQYIGKHGWSDSALLSAAGVPTVYFGPGGGGAHAAEEWIDLASLQAFTRILGRTAYAFCGAG